jgi:hypothetical protein
LKGPGEIVEEIDSIARTKKDLRVGSFTDTEIGEIRHFSVRELSLSRRIKALTNPDDIHIQK